MPLIPSKNNYTSVRTALMQKMQNLSDLNRVVGYLGCVQYVSQTATNLTALKVHIQPLKLPANSRILALAMGGSIWQIRSNFMLEIVDWVSIPEQGNVLFYEQPGQRSVWQLAGMNNQGLSWRELK